MVAARLEVVADVKARTPEGVYRRQVYELVSYESIAPDPNASLKNRKTQENNCLRISHALEVKARLFWGHGAYVDAAAARIDGLAVMPKASEGFIQRKAPVPGNIHLAHFNNLRGVNLYGGVTYLTLISRPAPPPPVTERMAWAASDKVGEAIQPVVKGVRIEINYRKRKVGRLMRDGTGRAAGVDFHPDAAAERIRWAICEAELLQVEARARAMWHSVDRPLLINIVTSVPLPLPIDELITWQSWLAEVGPIELLRARGIDLGDDKAAAGVVTRLLPDTFKDEQSYWNYRRTATDGDGQDQDKRGNEVASNCESPIDTVLRLLQNCR